MSVTHRKGSVLPKCPAGGASLYDYSTRIRPDAEGRAACPTCGKVVQLQRRYAWRIRDRIPAHNAQPIGSNEAEAHYRARLMQDGDEFPTLLKDSTAQEQI